MEQPTAPNNQPRAEACACCGGEHRALTHSINGSRYCEQCGETLRRMIASPAPAPARRSTD